MLYSSLLIAATTLCGLASAQNYSTTGPISIVPSSVPLANRTDWCIDQRENCPLVCGGHAFPNNCSETTLTYTCTCSDGSHPNISSYANMLPSLICTQWVIDCVAAAGNNLQDLTNCRSVKCGDKDPGSVKKVGGGGSGSGSSSSASAPSATASSSSTGGSGGGGSKPTKTSGGGASAASSSGAAVALNVARNYGTGILAGSLLAVFGFVL